MLVVPLAGNHTERVVTDGAEVGNHVVAAVDVRQCRVKRYIEQGQLVVVAKQTLQEGLVCQSKLGKIVVGAVYEEHLRAVGDGERSQIVVGAN